eukprot:GHRQ01025362.1.p2 GENE.GHRQ01025362.1~~GHRQ01025362.1.p2  ORF type:complete len:102 (+),score=54.83 GHRQ01025362.1:530-835(+)
MEQQLYSSTLAKQELFERVVEGASKRAVSLPGAEGALYRLADAPVLAGVRLLDALDRAAAGDGVLRQMLQQVRCWLLKKCSLMRSVGAERGEQQRCDAKVA